MRLLWTTLLIGCASTDVTSLALNADGHDVLAADDLGPAARRSVTLTATPAIRGGELRVSVSGANPGETIAVAVSKRGLGVGPCYAGLGGLCLDIVSPFPLGDITADANGAGELVVTVPAIGADELALQATITRGAGGATSVASNAVVVPVADTAVDEFVHEQVAVDFLWVLDDSCSMQVHQSKLAATLPVFLDALEDLDLDFHFGVVTTDVDVASAGELREVNGERWLTADSPTLRPSARAMVNVGTLGSAYEQGLAAMYLAIDPNRVGGTVNAGFEREDAQLSVMVLTDESDQSPERPLFYEELLRSRKALPGAARLSLIGPEGACAFPSGPVRYDTVAIETDGALEDICANDFSAFLDAVLGELYTSQPMTLSQTPPGDVAVWAIEPDGTTLQLTRADFTFDAATLTLVTTANYAPPAGTVIRVVY